MVMCIYITFKLENRRRSVLPILRPNAVIADADGMLITGSEESSGFGICQRPGDVLPKQHLLQAPFVPHFGCQQLGMIPGKQALFTTHL